MKRFPYPYNNRTCYSDAVIENVPITLYALMSTDTEENAKNGASFNIASLRICIRNTNTVII